MNVLIPIGGLGERFARHGFRFPKPLVNIVGRPMVFWLLDNLSLQPGDRVTIIVDEAVDANFGMVDRIRLEYAREPWELRAVLLPYHTRGAAETVFVALQGMSADELSRRTISLDCDTIYFSDVLATFRAAPAGSSACFCFEDHGDKPMFSYIEVDGKARVTAIREKIKISTVANTGAYAFATGELLRRHCQSVIDSSCGASGELYISSAIRSMLEEGAVVEAVHVERFACVGTPAQLAQFLALIADGTVASRRIRVVFDLDNTLVTAPRTPGDYSTCEPKERNINLLRSLHAAGHYVIIWTARRMRTHGGNVGAIVRDVGLVTMSSLQLFGIPYDELHFGKPHADIYVDDLAVNALVDTEKEVGWAPQPPRSGLLPSRPHNCVVELDGSVVKSSTPDRLRGELAFYRAIPSELQLLFPKLLSVEETPSLCSFVLERVQGVPLTHLLVSRALTPEGLHRVLRALWELHNFCPRDPPTNVYANYAPKVAKRYAENACVYEKMPDAARVYDSIMTSLRRYEEEKRARGVCFMHGDPVFTNVMFAPCQRVKLLDMRGALGDRTTTEGDALYDLAKVYQSLCGYDFAFRGVPIDERSERYLQELRAEFWEYVKLRGFDMDDITMITSSLFFSLLPLHEDERRRKLYFEMACGLMEGGQHM